MILASSEVLVAVLLRVQLLGHSLTKNMTGITMLETSVTMHQSTRRSIPKELRLHHHFYVNKLFIYRGEKQPLFPIIGSGAKFLHFRVAFFWVEGVQT